MSRTGTLILLGVLVILIPFSGLPVAIRSSLLVISGISVLSIGLFLRVNESKDTANETSSETKSEIG
jgi:hypothetical protein